MSEESMRVRDEFTCASEELTAVDWLICVRLTAPIESPSTVTAAAFVEVAAVSELLTLARDELMPVTDDPNPTRLELTLPRLVLVDDSALLTRLTLELVADKDDDNPTVEMLTLPRLVLTPVSEVLTPPREELTLPRLELTFPRLVLICVWLLLMLMMLVEMLMTDVLTLITVLLMIVTDELTLNRLVLMPT